jgi:hypothetical protein
MSIKHIFLFTTDFYSSLNLLQIPNMELISCHIMACLFISFHVIHFILYHVISCQNMSYRVKTFHIMSYLVLSCHFMCHWTLPRCHSIKSGGRGQCLPRPSATEKRKMDIEYLLYSFETRIWILYVNVITEIRTSTYNMIYVSRRIFFAARRRRRRIYFL